MIGDRVRCLCGWKGVRVYTDPTDPALKIHDGYGVCPRCSERITLKIAPLRRGSWKIAQGTQP